MANKPPFDVVRACFFLIAGIIAVHCLIAIAGAIDCIVFTSTIVEKRGECDPKGRLAELLAAALAAALAFLSGARKDK